VLQQFFEGIVFFLFIKFGLCQYCKIGFRYQVVRKVSGFKLSVTIKSKRGG
jgi:hypothetical protein